METQAQRLKMIRKLRGMTQSELANAVGKTLNAIQKYEAGERQLDKTTALVLNLKLGVNLEWLETGEGSIFEQDTVKEGECSIPIYDVAAAAGYGAWINGEALNGYYKMPTDLVRRDWGINHKNAIMLYVKGDSMTPKLQSGDLVAIDKSQTEAKKGMYVCRIENSLYIKNIVFQQSTVTLLSENPDYDPIIVPYDDFELIGKVVWYGRKL